MNKLGYKIRIKFDLGSNKMILFSLISLSLFLFSCEQDSLYGFMKTESEIYYKFDKEGDEKERPEIGDMLLAETKVYIDNTLIFDNQGKPQQLFYVDKPSFNGDINEILPKLRVGCIASVVILADSLAKNNVKMPNSYVAGTGQKVYYNISLLKITKQNTNFINNLQQNLISKNAIETYHKTVIYRGNSNKDIACRKIKKEISSNNTLEKGITKLLSEKFNDNTKIHATLNIKTLYNLNKMCISKNTISKNTKQGKIL